MWAFVHIIMGVTVSVALMLVPLGFFYKYIHDKYGVDYAYALHFSISRVDSKIIDCFPIFCYYESERRSIIGIV
jgi:hypothetical protein